jgi:hypothetical protein
LEVFFNGPNSSILKLESSDAHVKSEDKLVVIGCVFTDLPEKIVLDSQTETTLKEEYLLNEEGDLEIIKEFDCSKKNPSETVFALAKHPTHKHAKDLLELNNEELKQRAEKIGVDLTSVDVRSNPKLRAAIRKRVGDLQLDLVKVPLNKKNAKDVWGAIAKQLPTFALFCADRPSKDDDSEVQDPMKVAIQEAIKSVQDKLEEVKEAVQKQVMEVANRTIEKLHEMNPKLASELVPKFKAEPNWGSLFKLSLLDDNQIPINKRGSGVRRLILLNFFRAEVERRQQANGGNGIIYAIEEPETAQHPDHQKMLINALKNLSQQDNCQVIITTHVPGLAGMLPVESLRYIEADEDGNRKILEGNESVYEKVAKQLGVLPDLLDQRVQLFVCVEGPHDVRFLYHISRMLNKHDPEVPVLGEDPRIVVLPLGGSTLKEWVQMHYLKRLGKPEIHIYDRDDGSTPRYEDNFKKVNARGDGSKAFITKKREMENYLHPDAIKEEFGFSVEFGDLDDVPEKVARMEHENSKSEKPWEELSKNKKKQKMKDAKRRLNDGAASKMTLEQLHESDPEGEIIHWLKTIASKLTTVSYV